MLQVLWIEVAQQWICMSAETACRLDHTSGRPCVECQRHQTGLSSTEVKAENLECQLLYSCQVCCLLPARAASWYLLESPHTSRHSWACAPCGQKWGGCAKQRILVVKVNSGAQAVLWDFAQNCFVFHGWLSPRRCFVLHTRTISGHSGQKPTAWKPNEPTALSACGSQVDAWRTIGWGHPIAVIGELDRNTNECLCPCKGQGICFWLWKRTCLLSFPELIWQLCSTSSTWLRPHWIWKSCLRTTSKSNVDAARWMICCKAAKSIWRGGPWTLWSMTSLLHWSTSAQRLDPSPSPNRGKMILKGASCGGILPWPWMNLPVTEDFQFFT